MELPVPALGKQVLFRIDYNPNDKKPYAYCIPILGYNLDTLSLCYTAVYLSGLMTLCDLNSAYQALVLCLSQSEDEAQKATCTATTRKMKSVCGWNQLVKLHFENYQKHYWEWKDDIGNENLRQEVQKCKAKFKVALKNCRRDKEKNIADKLATDCAAKDFPQFWRRSDSTHQVVVCLTSHKT